MFVSAGRTGRCLRRMQSLSDSQATSGPKNRTFGNIGPSSPSRFQLKARGYAGGSCSPHGGTWSTKT
ncbi:hypothetical protein AALP_AA2G205100 [Arabis alpina]|uniref:Uncharacterized protein n=1 Tax=Arabis alpina TaxID=50452 RepID=A0A087HIV0_ARAAL|nr:hypothetical protein AALP_AA2G205100 [Arabis alpina]